ncbi:hypothetical protein [Actinoalloteichus caeruleus]|uniref:hypothetical protein n=1 Tax=Actinoalloteichus cyanogriseus TaxID=2893586 RepID=UPI003AAA2EE6
MDASPRRHGMYYRCPARTLAPGSAALAEHPRTVYVREDVIRDAVNGWIGWLFAPTNVERTVRALLASQDDGRTSKDRESARRRLTEAEASSAASKRRWRLASTRLPWSSRSTRPRRNVPPRSPS